jgi:hypothetical protein
MRTTLNVDDDILFAVQERARREKSSAGKVLSNLVREALRGQRPPHQRDHYGFAPLPPRGKTVSNALINRLREEEGE